jgi:hypothetical protein
VARVDETTTAALRTGQIEPLVAAFAAHVSDVSKQRAWDGRDEMLSLAAFFDCARRLGHEPGTLFGQAAASSPEWFRNTFEAFARRDDVTLAAFGWSIVETADGPAYRFAWPRWRLLGAPRATAPPEA